jgi:type VI secretion system protein ImpA
MESVIDIEALVAPISEDNPCGEDPRNDTGFDSAYHKLKDAREAAMAVERPDRSAQPENAEKGAVTDLSKWKTVVDCAASILQDSAKDLEVCALLVEGLARIAGPAGIRDAFLVSARIVDNYWDDLFPRIDPTEEDSLEDRIAAFTGLNGIGQPGTLATYIAKIPVTDDGGMDNFRSYDYDRAWTVNSNPDPDTRDTQAAALGFTLEEIENAAQQTSAQFYIDLDQSIRECRDALQALDQAFMAACGHDAPPSSMINDALEKFTSVISYLGRDKLEQHASSGAGDSVAPGAEPGGAQPAANAGKKNTQASGAISSREDAIARLRAVATYFRETEPHSPVSYSLQNLIRWSQLPLDKLIEEWIQDHDARERYMLMTGMRLQEKNED